MNEHYSSVLPAQRRAPTRILLALLRGNRITAFAGMALLCVSSASAQALPPPAAATVNIVDFMKFEPAVLTVAPGTVVSFSNHDGSNHIVKFSDLQSPRLRHGASWQRSFPRAGEYAYQCAIHGAAMSGKVVVK